MVATKIAETKFDEVIALIEKSEKDPTHPIEGNIFGYFNEDKYLRKAVLGIDIYQYSKYEPRC